MYVTSRSNFLKVFLFAFFVAMYVTAGAEELHLLPDGSSPLKMFNVEAPIPPQCYTKTEGRYNPCYVCHQSADEGRLNQMDDGHLQLEYSFSEEGVTNHWENLFEDFSERVAVISDQDIDDWVDKDNYSDLHTDLMALEYRGYVPDLVNLDLGRSAFSDEGFALDRSLWVAFNYKPFPSTFWPTNGSFGDAMIRLPAEFAQSADGKLSLEVYKANLALLEMAIKGVSSIDSLPIDERAVGDDLNRDSVQTLVHTVDASVHYFGAARRIPVKAQTFPVGTEFLHTIRYLQVAEDGRVTPSRRMKEVRYMKKVYELNPRQLSWAYEEERLEKELGALPAFPMRRDGSLNNKFGWAIDHFVEDARGRLRPTNYEEKAFCMGCHSTIGVTIDSTFSFARKPPGELGWGYSDLSAMPDAPSLSSKFGEYREYVERVGGGSEFRNNSEFVALWMIDGEANTSSLEKADVYSIVVPSAERARLLNKASKILMENQTYRLGRIATLEPTNNVHRHVDESVLTLKEEFDYDIRLDWGRSRD